MNKKLKYLLLTIAMVLSLSMSANIPVSAADATNRVIDEAGIIDDSDEAALNAKIHKLMSEKFDVVILTVNSLDGKTPEAYADDYYDDNGYGLDDEHSGVLFMVSMGERKYHISTTGKGIKAFTDYGIDEVKDRVKQDLSDGNYYDAFDEFLDITKDFYNAYKEGKPYDVDNPYMSTGDKIILEVIGFVIAFIIALISVLIMKFRMNNARPKGSAGEYIKKDSMVIKEQKDMFMYSNINKVKRQTQSSSGGGGGSSTHHSSSGRSHGGGGGSF